MDSEEIDPFDDAISRVLDGRRAEKRLSVATVAERAKLNRRTVYRYLRGERPIPMSSYMAMCLAMGVDAAEVVEAALKIVQAAEQESRG